MAAAAAAASTPEWLAKVAGKSTSPTFVPPVPHSWTLGEKDHDINPMAAAPLYCRLARPKGPLQTSW